MRDNAVFILSLFDTGLYAGQLFHKYGFKVLGFDFNPQNNGFNSSVIETNLSANPITAGDKLIELLINKALTFYKKPLLVPASEIYLRFMAINREVLRKYFLFILPNNEVLNSVLDKSQQFVMAEKIGLNVPKYSVIRGHDDLPELNKHHEFPMIIKGADQHIWKQAGLPKSFVAKSKQELDIIGNNLLGQGVSFIVQKMIVGSIKNNYEHNTLAYNGEIVLGSTIQKVRQYSKPYGAASSIQLCVNDDVRMLTEKFVIENGLEGFCNTEFKYDPVKKKYYFIECNARIWLQIKLSEHIGLSFIMAYAKLLDNPSIVEKLIPRSSPFLWVDFPFDLMIILKSFIKQPLRGVKELAAYRHARSFGLLCSNDLNPFFARMLKK